MPASLYDEIKLVCRATGVPISEFLRRAAIQRLRALDHAGTIEAEILKNLWTPEPRYGPLPHHLTDTTPSTPQCEPPSDPPTSSSRSPGRSTPSE